MHILFEKWILKPKAKIDGLKYVISSHISVEGEPNKLTPRGKYQITRMKMLLVIEHLVSARLFARCFYRHYFTQPSQYYEVLIIKRKLMIRDSTSKVIII